MKRNFTKILAAFALLVFMAPSMVAWGQTTVSIDNFTAISGSIDANISYAAYKGNGTTAPAVSGGTLRIYKPSSGSSDGGYITITAALGCELNSVTITNSDDKAGTIKYSVDGGNLSDAISFAKSAAYTVENLTATSVSFYNCGGDRLSIAGFSVIYTGGGSQPTTYTVTYDCNGGTSGCPENVTGITAGTSINLADAPTKTNYTFNGWSDGTTTYNAGASYTVNSNVTMTAQWQLSISSLFYESFDDCNGTGGNDNQWSGTIASSTLISDNEGWTFANGNGAYKCAKFGAGSKLGSAQTPAISYTGNATLTFKAAAWNGSSESTTLKLSATSGTLSASTVTLVKGAWTDYTINITGIATSTQIKFEGNAASNSRFFLDEVMVVEAAPSTDPYITAEDIEIACNATSGSIAYTINNEPDPAGTLTTAIVEGGTIANLQIGTITSSAIPFTCSANTTGIARTATVTLTYTYGDNETVTKDVTITQTADLNATDNISDITEAGPYVVKGKIFAKSNRGFVLGDGTGYVYVYKTTSDFNVGDFVKVTGTITDQYNGIFEFPSSSTITSVDAYEIASADPTVMTGSAITTFVNYEGAILSSYVQYEGVLNISTSGNNTYYNLTIDGTDVQGSISYPTQDLTSFDGKAVRVTGYYVGKSGSTTTYFNTMLESISATEPSITVDPISVNATIEGGSGTLTVTYENITTINANVFFCDAEGESATYDWVSAAINSSNNVEYTIDANEGAARTAYMKVYVGETYSSLITINQAGFVAIDLRGVTTSLSFNAGAFESSGAGYKDYDNVTYTGSNEVEYGGWTLRQVMHSGENMQMKASTGKVYMPTILTDNGFTITVSAETNSVLVGVGEESEENEFTTTATSADVVISAGTKYAVISTITITPLQTPTPESYTLTITGYTDVTEGTNNKGYYLIASPVTVDPATVEGMTTGDFDLYYFDDSQDVEWINYKADDNGAINNFNLVPGKGYLYAKKATAETPSYSFNLTGAPYTGTGEIPVAAGWNLIGNPFGVEAEISSDYYALTYESNELIATTAATHVAAMQGVFVNADEDDTVIFEAVENNTPGKGQNIALNLSKATRGASTIDRAIVRFDEGQQLPKFQLFENSTKLYIPQGNKDFAIVRSAAEGEMPVNFRTSENGTYTLSIETENVEMNYLHLIDNMTGADVDLLATPNYTFEARTNDYSSRFRLVFSAEENGASTDSATFAYFNGTSWTVSNTGDATLQVVDITGRIVGSETINGNATVSLNQPAGIYMLRLVNGNDVKVQKVVVR